MGAEHTAEQRAARDGELLGARGADAFGAAEGGDAFFS